MCTKCNHTPTHSRWKQCIFLSDTQNIRLDDFCFSKICNQVKYCMCYFFEHFSFKKTLCYVNHEQQLDERFTRTAHAFSYVFYLCNSKNWKTRCVIAISEKRRKLNAAKRTNDEVATSSSAPCSLLIDFRFLCCLYI